jgi:hydroxyacylglutathione hydrolase
MIKIKSFTFNPFMENTYVLYDHTRECIIIDPGCFENFEEKELQQFITENQLKVTQLINTHCHVDHVLGNHFIKEHYKVPFYIHPIEEATLKSVKVYAPAYGFHNYQETTADGFLQEGECVRFGNSTLEIFFVPGHAPGHIALYNKEQKICIGGDVLFQGSIGRTDLPGGDFDTLAKSIRTKLYSLPDDTIVYPGHGPSTTIGEEKKFNPFVPAR